MKTIAVVRQVSPAIAACQLTHLERVPIDWRLAQAQHDGYVSALAELGCRLIELPSDPDLPDSVFVEDTALVLDEIGIITRPGTEARRRECAAVSDALRPFRELRHIEEPGTLEGGDILVVERDIFVGVTSRTNPAGISQLGDLVREFGYSVRPVPVRGCLHLKSAVTMVGPGLLLMNRRWVDAAEFTGFQVIDVDEGEPFGANLLPVGGGLIYPVSFPRTCEKLEARGLTVHAVDVSELQKAEGAVTCCSLIFSAK